MSEDREAEIRKDEREKIQAVVEEKIKENQKSLEEIYAQQSVLFKVRECLLSPDLRSII